MPLSTWSTALTRSCRVQPADSALVYHVDLDYPPTTHADSPGVAHFRPTAGLCQTCHIHDDNVDVKVNECFVHRCHLTAVPELDSQPKWTFQHFGLVIWLCAGERQFGFGPADCFMSTQLVTRMGWRRSVVWSRRSTLPLTGKRCPDFVRDDTGYTGNVLRCTPACHSVALCLRCHRSTRVWVPPGAITNLFAEQRSRLRRGVLALPRTRRAEWGNLQRALKQYKLSRFTGWGDLPRHVLPENASPRMMQRVQNVSQFAKARDEQLLAMNESQLGQAERNASDLVDDRWYYYRSD
ncbi:hypothetical protein BDZ89DRAFT_1151301 [Hymenopellis radicata]|nr:hypothetical protein BDZ89DRAFT_1151301 [Hymenopellis radicata]